MTKTPIVTEMPPNTTCATRPAQLSMKAKTRANSSRSSPNGSIDGPTIETQTDW